MHLKVIQQMSKFPRTVGIPPLSDAGFDEALTVQPSANPLPPQNGDDDGKINPLAGMGLTDEQYAMILQGLVSGDVGLVGIDGGMSAGVGVGAE